MNSKFIVGDHVKYSEKGNWTIEAVTYTIRDGCKKITGVLEDELQKQ
jgi:hypothetical protein